MSFVRRYSALPTLAEIRKVSGVVIVDTPPAQPLRGAAFGKIAIVGEFEDGAFNVPTDLLSDTDQPKKFGTFGYQYGGTKYRYACAVKSGGSEAWNGNGWVQTAALKFGGLCFVRVDTSIGEVALTPLAYVQGTIKPTWKLIAGDTFKWKRDGGGAVTATFAATAAAKSGVGATYPQAFVGGEVLEVSYNGSSWIPVVIQPGETSGAAIAARINATLGFAFATFGSQLTLTSPTKGTGSNVNVKTSATATALGFTTGQVNGTGDVVDIDAVTLAELAAKVATTDATSKVVAGPTGYPRLVSKTAGNGTIQVTDGTANAALGFTDMTTSGAKTAAPASDVTIPAGTRCTVTGSEDALRVVTMVTTTVAKGATGSTSVKVRPAVDDGTYAGTGGATVVKIEDQPSDLEWSVTNPSALTAALTASQIDSRYLDAIRSTKGPGNDTRKKINGILSARQSAAIRGAIKTNAEEARAEGHYDRRGFVFPGINVTSATMLGASAPGVAAYRSEPTTYCGGGVKKVMQELIDGGYSSDGVVYVHSDTIMASRWSLLPPGTNPGQVPENPLFRLDVTTFPGLDTEASSWTLETYAALNAAGVSAVDFDKDVGVGFEQGLTAVDPTTEPERSTIARATAAGYIGDSCAQRLKIVAKRQGSEERRDESKDAITGFLQTLTEGRDAIIKDNFVVNVRDYAVGVVEFEIIASLVGSDDVILVNLRVGPNAVELARAA